MTPEDLLQKYGMRQTDGRVDILNIFKGNEHIALAGGDIEKEMGGSMDRVTVYRNLKAFEEKGILHRIVDDHGVEKYALCSDSCGHTHSHDHVHFQCNECGQLYCLDDVVPVTADLPKGFQKEEAKYLIVGKCDQCG